MKRNLDLIRQILFHLEALPAGTTVQALVFEGFDKATIIGHIDLMIEAELIDGIILKTPSPSGFLVHRIKWKGHELLANTWMMTLPSCQSKSAIAHLEACLSSFYLDNPDTPEQQS